MGAIRKVNNTYYIEFYARGLMYSQVAGEDLKAAEALLAKIEEKIAAGEALTLVREIDLPIFIEQFLNDMMAEFGPMTTRRFNAVARHFEDFLHNHFPHIIKLNQVTPSIIESYQGHLVKNYRLRLVNFSLLLLREMLEHGIKLGFINDNPTLHVRLLPWGERHYANTKRYQLAQSLLTKSVGLSKSCKLLRLNDIARVFYFANLIPLNRLDSVSHLPISPSI